MDVSKRNIGLDGLRAAAILAVVLSHELRLSVAGVDLLSMFGSGVELFFVLSGFLIGRIYFRSSDGGSFSFWNFWRSRWWRTLPPYFAAILVYLAVRLAYPFPPLRWYYALFLQNYLGITQNPIGLSGFGPSWSLCVEEHFYLLLPIIGTFIDRFWGRRAFRYLLPIAFFVPTILRFGMIAVDRNLPAQWFWFSHLHCEGLIAGVWLAYLFVDDRAAFERLKTPAKWLLPVCPMLLLIPLWSPRPLAIDMLLNTLFALGYAGWLRYLYDMTWDPKTSWARMAKSAVVGTALCSYSVYLTHATVGPLIRNRFLGDWHRSAAKSLLVLSLTFLIGVIFYFLVERPTIISRDRYLKGNGKKEAKLHEPVAVS